MFLGALYALAKGDAQGVRYVRRQARKDLLEIEQVWSRETLGSLPDTAQELLSEIEDPQHDADVEGLAEALGAVKRCAICGTRIIDPFSFAESVVQHYDLDGSQAGVMHERIETAVRQCGVETGGWDSSLTLCSYHDAQR